MANPEHLKILKAGVEVWNNLRKEHSQIQPGDEEANFTDANLRRVDLRYADLQGADLRGADFLWARLEGANLSNAYFAGAVLIATKLGGANLNGAYLNITDLSRADLTGADLRGAILRHSKLSYANLSNADMSGANLHGANLFGANLTGTSLNQVIASGTNFADIDLRTAKGLESLNHQGPSEISISTLYRSEGKIPEVFLRGCGVPEDFITYARSLTTKAIDFYSCFISYSSTDQEFTERLHADLQAKGVRVWFAPHDMKIGAHIRPTIDKSIRVYDKLLLVLSEHSVGSRWVEQEVETALAKEEEAGREVLFPVRLDDAVMGIQAGWPALVKRTRHIGDFTHWKEHDSYQKALERLLRDLKAGA